MGMNQIEPDRTGFSVSRPVGTGSDHMTCLFSLPRIVLFMSCHDFM